MTTAAVSGVGAELRKYDGSGWRAIGEVTNITGPSMSRETIDVTSLDSTGGYREFITGLRNPGTLTFTMNFTEADYVEMKTDFESDTAVDYELIIPDGNQTSLEMTGYVTELPLTVPISAAITCDVSIQISGSVTVNSGSGS